jgi:sodium transport system permease protein
VPQETQEFAKSIGDALGGAPNWWVVLGLMALLPALCEEIAFRGFVLSGLRHVGHKWWAIGLSAVAFGLVHPIPHQKIPAIVMGFVIGYVAVQTSSLWPCILLHAVHNSLGLLVQNIAESVQKNPRSPLGFLLGGEEPLLYHPITVAACGVGVAAILWGLHGVRYRRTAEEQLEEARQRRDSPLVGA